MGLGVLEIVFGNFRASDHGIRAFKAGARGPRQATLDENYKLTILYFEVLKAIWFGSEPSIFLGKFG